MPQVHLARSRKCDHDDFVFARKFLECVRALTWDFLSELEVFVVFALAEILRAEKFLRADDLCALFRRSFGRCTQNSERLKTPLQQSHNTLETNESFMVSV